MKKDSEILHIYLARKWFDEIKENKKKIEYRLITHYWAVRLLNKQGYYYQFDYIIFHNGYSNDTLIKKHIKTIDSNGLFEIHFE